MFQHQILLALLPVVMASSLVHSEITAIASDSNHRRVHLAEMTTSDSTKAANALERRVRELAEQLPTDLSICDEYFFGRQSGLSNEQLPFCVHGGYCKASWIRDPDHPCECLEGFAGPHCEYLDGQEPETCVLGCENGGTCKMGAPSWQHYYRGVNEETDTWSNPLDLQHCACPAGFSGLLCERRGTSCGTNYCHNGGTCIQTNQPDGSIKHFCDCSTSRSVTIDGPKVFGGEFCEYESTDFCSKESDPNGEQFCVNGGECKSESHLGCNCQAGYVGPICEFVDGAQDPPECKLKCENHGFCRKGIKDVSVLEKYGLGNRRMEDGYSDDFEHCVCPKGYVGLQCEFQLDICPGGVHACLNGGECVAIPNGNNPQDVTYGCDCSSAESRKSRFAGLTCEMESTEFCTIDHAKSTAGVGLNSFCTNGGKCRGHVQHFEEHPGCNCPKHYGGENCQFEEDRRSGGAIAGIAMALVASSLLGTFLLLRIRRRQKMRRYFDHMASKSGIPPSLDLMARAMEVDDMEFGDGGSVAFATPPTTERSLVPMRPRSDSMSDDEVRFMRQSEWPNGRPDSTTALSIFNDIPVSPMAQESIILARKKEWPNDRRNDALNPIHIFDDISESTPDLSPVQSTRKIV